MVSGLLRRNFTGTDWRGELTTNAACFHTARRAIKSSALPGFFVYRGSTEHTTNFSPPLLEP